MWTSNLVFRETTREGEGVTQQRAQDEKTVTFHRLLSYRMICWMDHPSIRPHSPSAPHCWMERAPYISCHMHTLDIETNGRPAAQDYTVRVSNLSVLREAERVGRLDNFPGTNTAPHIFFLVYLRGRLGGRGVEAYSILYFLALNNA